MYRVALCDDDQLFSEQQEKICREILDKLNVEYQIHVFDCSKDFLCDFSHNKRRFDLVLLDIVMEKPNGMELALLIRQTDPDASIIFITSNRDYALQGYDVKALHYLMKPIDSEVLEKLITSDYQNRILNHFYILKKGLQNLKIPIKDIIYLETTGRRVTVTLFDGTGYYAGKLADILDELPKEQFVRCHQSFAINIQNIRELTRQSAISINGVSVPVSRTFMKDVQKAFARQLRAL